MLNPKNEHGFFPQHKQKKPPKMIVEEKYINQVHDHILMEFQKGRHKFVELGD